MQAPIPSVQRVLPDFPSRKEGYLTIEERRDTQGTADWEVEMDNGPDGGMRSSAVSDTELLRRIGQDLHSMYADVIRQPLPRRTQAILALIDREQRLGEQLPCTVAH